MAYDDYDDDEEPRTAEEMLDHVRRSLGDVEERLKKLNQSVDDSAASLRLEVALNRREMAELRAVMGRLQARFDNQLTTLVVANIASGIGVAALVLGANRAF